ncbi:uncharacterized protein LOC112087593 [Eutrema salsugineum]|uniref:uncharacterized protein LOC112087593 n=1 Tax=Eutrema salsugineum TaxID=72664 RepID=UPI000CECE415|nr:uncharacterized protein LOC112087593 [Eutrema salsugineum]
MKRKKATRKAISNNGHISPSVGLFPATISTIMGYPCAGFTPWCTSSRFFDLQATFSCGFSSKQGVRSFESRKPPWRKSYIFSVLLQFSSQIHSKFPMGDNLRQRMQNINLGIDDEPVLFPTTLLNQASTTNQFSLVVVPLNPKKQNLRAMISALPRVWGLEDATSGRIIGHNQLQFLFRSEDMMNLVLQRTPWSFADWMVTVHRWMPNLTETSRKMLPFWMQIRGIPIQFLSRQTITFIGDLYGQVIGVDFDENSTRVDFVRVRVLWNSDIPLRFQRIFQFENGINTILRFKFERLRNFCKRCGLLSHDKKDCPLRLEDGDFSDSDGDGDDNGGNDPDQGLAMDNSTNPSPPNTTVLNTIPSTTPLSTDVVDPLISNITEAATLEDMRLRALRWQGGKSEKMNIRRCLVMM